MTDILKVDAHFTVLPNQIVRDTRLTLEARGMLGLIISMSEDWKFWRSKMMELSGCKKHKYYRILKELQDLGYLSIEDIRDKDGLFIGKAWTVHNDPCTDNQDPVKPAFGEIGTHKKNNLNKNTKLQENTPLSPKENDLFQTNLPASETKTDVEICFEEFNQMAERNNLPKCQAINKTRISKMKKRMKECGGIDGWRAALAKVEASDYMLGRNNGFKCTIDFMLQESGFAKLMEGNYDNRTDNPNGSDNNRSSTASEALDRGAQAVADAYERGDLDWTPRGNF